MPSSSSSPLLFLLLLKWSPLFLSSGDKPHVCQVCDKRFALACNLRAHLKTHQTAGPGSSLTPVASSSVSSVSSSANNGSNSGHIINGDIQTSHHSLSRSSSTSPHLLTHHPVSSPTPSSHSSQSTSSPTSRSPLAVTTGSVADFIADRNEAKFNLVNPSSLLLTTVNGLKERQKEQPPLAGENLQQFLNLMTASFLAMKHQQAK